MKIEDQIAEVRAAANNLLTLATYAEISEQTKEQIKSQVSRIQDAINGEGK